MRSQGIVSLDSICHLDAPRKAAVAALIKQRVRKGELVEVVLDGAGKQQHWAQPQALETSADVESELVHILSPFDPLVIQRKRTKLFFGYEHRFEAYVPKDKRVLGYFALPVVVGDEIVAAVDLKTDRQNKKLLVQQWTWVGAAAKRGNAGARKELKRGSRTSCTASSGFSWGSEGEVRRCDPRCNCGRRLASFAMSGGRDIRPPRAATSRQPRVS